MKTITDTNSKAGMIISAFLIAACLLILAIILSSCTTPQSTVSAWPVVSTNATGTVVTNTILVTNTVYLPDTNRINQIAGAAQSGLGIASTFYPPALAASPLIPWGASLLLAISTALAAYKSQQNKNILSAVVQGVESAAPTGGNDATSITLAAVKQSIKDSASAAGVQPALHAIVQSNT